MLIMLIFYFLFYISAGSYKHNNKILFFAEKSLQIDINYKYSTLNCKDKLKK